ncbi:MAG: hypothetical protein NC043_09500 [Muribaculaceae bacterium]|nr:hypothetical protein [Muribaculaceae bacterium]
MAQFKDSATMARWALLYSEAMAANSLTAPTDTIINIAVSYYGSHNEAAAFSRACELRTLLLTDTSTSRSNALATALYLQKEKEFMLYKERTKREQTVLISLIAALLAAGVIVWQRQHLALRSAQNEALIAEASLLKEGLTLQQTQNHALSSRLADSLSGRFRIIDELCQAYYESQGTKTEKKAIADRVKAHIADLKSDEGIFREMEACHRDMLAKLRDALPALKPDEYRMMTYLASGLSNRTIALLIGESIDTAYKRKSRLKAKITASDAPQREVFMAVFH